MSAEDRGDDVHPDELARVTGQLRYTRDVDRPGALAVAFVASSEPHARLVGVDVTAARAVEGVHVVLTGSDIGELRFGTSVKDIPVLANDRVLFAGQRIVAIAGDTPAIAQAAAELVVVDYDPLPPLLTIDDVMAASTDGLHPRASDYVGATPDHPVGNLQGFESICHGDVDELFASCDDLLEVTYTFGRSHSAPLEPHNCVVDVGPDRTEVWTSNKVPNRTRTGLAELLGIDPEAIVVHPASIGGDFGSKSALFLEGICALLSREAQRPVRAALSYAEMLTSTAARHAGSLRVRTGTSSGRLRAYEGEALLNGGAFAGVKPRKQRTVSLVGHAFAPYGVEARDERSVTLYSNTLPGGHVRSPGEFQALFAAESHIDELARRAGRDPLDFRRSQDPPQPVLAILDRLEERTVGWGSADDTGVGDAIFSCSAGRGSTRVECVVDADGAELLVGVPDQGSGMYRTLRRLAAEELRIPESSVRIRPIGASDRLVDSGAGSSRVTVVAGNAVLAAARSVIAELGEPPAVPDGYWIREALRARGVDQITTEGGFEHDGAASSQVPDTWSGLRVEVGVDRATGVVRVQRAVLVVVVGRVANPVGFLGQLEGGFVYGLGQTLFEHLEIEDGQVTTASLGDYKIPSVADVPPLEIGIIQSGDGTLSAAGELSNLGVAPAIANAVRDAVGVRLTRLPFGAEDVWRALSARDPRALTL